MANKDKQSKEYRIYIKKSKSWVDVNKEFYTNYYRDINAYRKRQQEHGRCVCPASKHYLCDMDCLICPYAKAGDQLSLDNTVSDSDGNEKSWLDDMSDESAAIAEVLEDAELLRALYAKLNELDPEGRLICQLVMQGKSERDCGKEMGLSRNTFVYRRDKLFQQSLSQNVKLGLQYRYQQGKVQINHNRFLGYTKDADGNLIIDPEQAEIVKRIYREYLEGLSMDKIAAGLERDGILTGAGGKRWHTSTINKILRNEKYIGDALLQKTYTTDFLNKTRVKNNGLVPQYYVEGNHEAIIPKDIYLHVQEELVRRRVVKTSANGKKRSYSCNHCFSQIVICGECGEMFRRLHRNNRGVKSIVWRCISRLESTGLECHARTINELVLQDAVVKAINQMLGDKSSYQAQLQLNIASVIRASQATSVENIDEKLMALQQELIQKAQSKEAYDEIADEIFRLRELRQKTTVDTATRDESR